MCYKSLPLLVKCAIQAFSLLSVILIILVEGVLSINCHSYTKFHVQESCQLAFDMEDENYI